MTHPLQGKYISTKGMVKFVFLNKISGKEMTRFLMYVFLVVTPFFGLAQQQQQQMKKDFTSAFTRGETSPLHAYFKGFVNVNIPGQKGFYPENKSRWLLQDFFQKHPVKTFSLKESGFSGDNFYLIGLYEGKAAQWNIYFLFSPGQKGFQVQQIDIEKNGK
jgi:hypothetical protein